MEKENPRSLPMQLRPILSLQEQFALQDEILLDRLDNLLPRLMEETKTEMWIVIGDECNEGPCLQSFLPSSFFHARRTSAFVFVHKEGKTSRYIISKPDFSIDRFYTPALLKPAGFDYKTFYTTFAPQYDLEMIEQLPEEDLWSCLSRIVKENNPQAISLDFSSESPFADGLTKTNYDRLVSALGTEMATRFVSGYELAIRWLETRTDKELALMKQIVGTTREIIKACYSPQCIQPGKTTIGEARFYLMEQATFLGMEPWFDATVWIRRKGQSHIESDSAVIQKGDLLHCDFGVIYAGLCSDVQEMAYVKDQDDDQLISELKHIHTIAMHLQDILAQNCQTGKSGNEILTLSLEKAKAEGISRPMIYSHPIGRFGHGPGPVIGSFGNQQFVKGSGERILNDSTCYAMELNVREPVPSWDNLQIMYGQEIDISFKDGTVAFFAGRQEQLHIIQA
jgi:Xaa-Pro aminopeptidase